jgi:hypothetical protein
MFRFVAIFNFFLPGLVFFDWQNYQVTAHLQIKEDTGRKVSLKNLRRKKVGGRKKFVSFIDQLNGHKCCYKQLLLWSVFFRREKIWEGFLFQAPADWTTFVSSCVGYIPMYLCTSWDRCYDWFLKYFRRKIQRKNWRFWLKTKPNYAKLWS